MGGINSGIYRIINEKKEAPWLFRVPPLILLENPGFSVKSVLNCTNGIIRVFYYNPCNTIRYKEYIWANGSAWAGVPADVMVLTRLRWFRQ